MTDVANVTARTETLDRPAPKVDSGAARLGTVLLGKYRLERVLGRGGQGVVYAAAHQTLARSFAVKLLTHGGANDARAYTRFRDEARITSKMRHPNVVEIVDFDVDGDGNPFAVLELLEGETLQERLSRGERIPLRQAIAWIRQAALGLEAAHAAGIVHRDVKPSNLFLASEGGLERVKVVDFGIAHLTDATQGGFDAGTPGYMAPEQLEGRLIDRRTDVFALGLVLQRMLNGRHAFGSGTAGVLSERILSGVREPLDVPADETVLGPLLDDCLARDPDRRVSSMGALVRALGELESALDAPATLSVTLPASRMRTRWPLGVAAMLGAVALVGVAVWSFSHAPAEERRPEPATPSIAASIEVAPLPPGVTATPSPDVVAIEAPALEASPPPASARTRRAPSPVARPAPLEGLVERDWQP
jgi:serine/threonine protein kinase